MSGRHASRLAALEAKRERMRPGINEEIERLMSAYLRMTPAERARLEAEATTDTDRTIYRELAKLAGARRTPNTQAKPPDTGQGAPGWARTRESGAFRPEGRIDALKPS